METGIQCKNICRTFDIVIIYEDCEVEQITKKKEFLAQIERIVPWKEWLALI